ncbi:MULTISPECIES: ABC transporter permease subunit [Geobacillus]|uniref:ABC transporter permease subunit n=1 Tax=Geobacillus proteiniphilus TaxID=860353 RepID=A0ABY9MHN0_9BACL|nr:MULTISPECIES: ABC transporter permease subunit [Geobacillus]AMV11218.1 ABC transporter permease [Geobacillus thermoleovorans]ASS86237.1 ABC transporter permease [Geobacillus lituanicus]KDE48074.1 ABC transporter permease [Geobacillus sp. CAMR5420]WMJ17527.1 ABC transporter permease subunit [Geobacillus proteiniphilus]
MWNIGRMEWRLLMRQYSSYSFVLLWVVILSLLFFIAKNDADFAGYTNVTGTIANIILYLLPLFMLIAGSFAIAGEMENGQWRLLCTYPLSQAMYVAGKWLGQWLGQATLFTFSFGVSVAISSFAGIALPVKWVIALYSFSLFLIALFLMLGLSVGAFTSTRWQALTVSVGVWFLFIMIWPTLLIAVLNIVPYPLIAPLLQAATLFNPAEVLRVAFVVELGGSAIFGQAYDHLIHLWQKKFRLILTVYAIGYLCLLWSMATWKLTRRKQR